MALFNKKEKVPDLPPAPQLPELPNPSQNINQENQNPGIPPAPQLNSPQAGAGPQIPPLPEKNISPAETAEPAPSPKQEMPEQKKQIQKQRINQKILRNITHDDSRYRKDDPYMPGDFPGLRRILCI